MWVCSINASRVRINGEISFRSINMRSYWKFFKIIAKSCREDNRRHTKLKRAFWLLTWIVYKTKIFTVMYFVEPIVCLFVMSMYVYSLFTNLILLDTIYSLKFLQSFFLQHNSYPGIIFLQNFLSIAQFGFIAKLKSRSRVAHTPQKLFTCAPLYAPSKFLTKNLALVNSKFVRICKNLPGN